jgi:hypothetical protein
MEVFHTAVGITGGDLASAHIAAMKKMAAKKHLSDVGERASNAVDSRQS